MLGLWPLQPLPISLLSDILTSGWFFVVVAFYNFCLIFVVYSQFLKIIVHGGSFTECNFPTPGAGVSHFLCARGREGENSPT